MIKNLAWNMFKKTGNIDTFLEYMELKNIDNNNVNGEDNGNNKDEWSSDTRK